MCWIPTPNETKYTITCARYGISIRKQSTSIECNARHAGCITHALFMSVINGNGAQPKQNKYIQIHNLIVNNISIWDRTVLRQQINLNCPYAISIFRAVIPKNAKLIYEYWKVSLFDAVRRVWWRLRAA